MIESAPLVSGILKLWEYWVSAVILFFVVAGDGAVGDQCAYSCPPFLISWCPCSDIDEMSNSCSPLWVHHLIDRYALNFKSVYVAFQRSAKIDWIPCDTDER